MMSNSNKPNMLEAALDYAGQGYRVIPLCFPNEEGACGCGWNHKDKEVGKAPRTMHGLNDASSDPDQIREWWKLCLEANIGLLTGHKNGFWALDVDAKSGGLESLEELEQEHGKLTTHKNNTGGGGCNFLYKCLQGVAVRNKKIRAGIETRGDGGYIVAPPSLHLSGKRYTANEQSEIEEAPAWLIELVTQPEGEHTASQPVTTKIYEGEGRNDACTREAGRLLNIYKDPEIVKSMVLVYNQAVCRPPLDPKECERTWEKSLANWSEKLEANQRALVAVPQIISARQLDGIDFPELMFAIPRLIPEGLTIIAGKPKSGKSWFALQAAYSVALGKNLLDRTKIERGHALVLGLEDGQRRLQSRIRRLNASDVFVKLVREEGKLLIRGNLGEDIPDGLDLAVSWPRIGSGGIEELEKYLDEHPDVRLVVIDTIKRFTNKKGKGTTYDEDYQSIQPLQELATRRKVAILGFHHVGKALADDPLDMVSGTFGLTGGADSILVMQREEGDDFRLSVQGRDIAEQELAIRFGNCLWTLLGNAGDVFISEEREDILGVLTDDGLTPKEIAGILEKDRSTVRSLLGKMLRDGQVVRDSKGRYSTRKAEAWIYSYAQRRQRTHHQQRQRRKQPLLFTLLTPCTMCVLLPLSTLTNYKAFS